MIAHIPLALSGSLEPTALSFLAAGKAPDYLVEIVELVIASALVAYVCHRLGLDYAPSDFALEPLDRLGADRLFRTLDHRAVGLEAHELRGNPDHRAEVEERHVREALVPLGEDLLRHPLQLIPGGHPML